MSSVTVDSAITKDTSWLKLRTEGHGEVNFAISRPEVHLTEIIKEKGRHGT